MHALGAKLAGQRLGEGTLGELASGEGAEEGGAAEGSGCAGDEERWGVRRGINGCEEKRDGLLSKVEEAVAVICLLVSVFIVLRIDTGSS